MEGDYIKDYTALFNNGISIHSLRVEGDVSNMTFQSQDCISIHSLRVEGDLKQNRLWIQFHISIHSLRVEGDRLSCIVPFFVCHFNPLPPCGGRLPQHHTCYTPLTISIHSLRVEGDYKVFKPHFNRFKFQSTPSVWRETRCSAVLRSSGCIFQSTPSVWRETLMGMQNNPFTVISIHSLRVEGDRDQTKT